MKLRTVALTGVMSLAGLGLVGAGAHAAFSTSTTSSQTITAGTLSVVLSSPTATSGNGTTALTLPSVTNVGSSFISPAQLITITNNGSVTANEINLQVTDSGSSALQTEMYLCLYSDSTIVFNGTVKADEALGNMAIGGSIAPSATDSYTAVFYAGDENTGCGNVSGYQYGTVDATDGALTTWPAGATAPDAGSPVGYSNLAGTLSNDAQGGTDTVTITMSYSG
jgi:predicted ribosomally synthesized peptide with SipW-like signal peptide